MKVSESTWEHKRNELLFNLSLYYEYEPEYAGRNVNYHILKKLGDYQKIPNKRDAKKRKEVYDSKIIEVIKSDNLQTAANIARIIQNDVEIKAFQHKLSTIQEYTRLEMREMFGRFWYDKGTEGRIMDKIWCRLDREHNYYIPMPEAAVNDFIQFFHNEQKASAAVELAAMNDYEIGLITKEERDSKIKNLSHNDYVFALAKFKEKHGYTPVKVPLYGFYGDHIIDFERESQMAA